MGKTRAFVRYLKGKIVPGSLITTSGHYPKAPFSSGKWQEIPADLCCDNEPCYKIPFQPVEVQICSGCVNCENPETYYISTQVGADGLTFTSFLFLRAPGGEYYPPPDGNYFYSDTYGSFNVQNGVITGFVPC